MREQFPVTRRYKYLNHAAISPPPLFVLEEAERYLRNVSELGTEEVNRIEEDDFRSMREDVAKLIGASWDEVAFVPNTSYGFNFIVHGLDWREGDNVVTDSLEFPTVVFPWLKLKRKVEVRIVKPNVETFEDSVLSHVDSRTRVVAVSHVGFNTGLVVDVKRLAREAHSQGALIVVDVIQSVGAVNVDVREMEADFAVAGGYKWLMSPQGSGFIYVRKGLLGDPPFYGWRTSKNFESYDATNFEIESGPRRLEPGTIDVAANLAMARAARFIKENSSEVLQAVNDLSGYANRRAQEEGLEVVTPMRKRAGITVVMAPKNSELSRHMLANGVVVSPRGGGIRISTHFYNTRGEVDEAVRLISQWVRRSGQ
ncbi:aminotransferase class V-fold PLP-dependent enzyme [Sulfodiicoccus acidiphilus]|nr:aminotransferase class V-fold PLP-dependent enzyme [Sulfodiicoccus acidiphilus]